MLFKTSSLQAFIPIPELCGNVAKVKSTFFHHLRYLQFFSPLMLVQLRAQSRPTFMSILRIAIQKGSQRYITSTPDTYQQFAQMLSRPDNTVPNWQKVRAVHLNMKVGCVSYTNQCFLSPPQNRNQAKWDIRVTQIPCDGSNLLQVNIKSVFEDWIYSFKLTLKAL